MPGDEPVGGNCRRVGATPITRMASDEAEGRGHAARVGGRGFNLV